MAEPESPSGGGGGFNLSKKYGPLPAWAWGLLGGGTLYAGYRFYQARKSASASSAATTADTTTQPVDYAPQISVLQAEIQQLQQGENGENVSKPIPVVPGEPGPRDNDNPGGPDVDTGQGTSKKMPNVVGQRANFAIGELKSGYGVIATTVPPRNPRQEYIVVGQTPRAGATVNSGSAAVLRVRVDQTKKPPVTHKRTSGRPPGRAQGSGGGPPVPEPGRITTPMRRV